MENILSTSYAFLQGGGEMGALTRAYNWRDSSLGSPDVWPHSLRTTVNIILNSRFPMFLFWGPDHICFYNDAYRPSLGEAGKHPHVVGRRGKDVWSEVWDVVEPQITQVMNGGEATWHEDQRLSIYRYGKMDFAYWTYSYSPVMDDEGSVGGVFVTCTETTDKVARTTELQESENRFRALADASGVFIGVGDDKGNAFYFNQAWVDLTGKPEKDLLRFGWIDLLHPDDQRHYARTFLEAFKVQQSLSGEFRVLNKDGHYRWMLAQVSPRFLPGGTFGGYVSSSIDITDAKQAATQNRENATLLEKIVNQSSLAIALLRGDHFVIDLCNRQILEMWGKPASIKGLPLIEALPEIKGQGFIELLQKVLHTGIPHQAHNAKAILMRDNVLQDRYFDYTYTPMRDASGSITGVIVLSIDVSLARKAQLEVARSEGRLRALIEQAPIATCLFVGRDMVVEIANRRMLDAWGKGDAVFGKPFREGVPELIGQPFLDILDNVYTSGKPYTAEAMEAILEVDGVMGTYYYDFTYQPIRDETGQVYAVMDMAIEVTEKVLARRKAAEAEAALGNAVDLAELASWWLDVPTGALTVSQRFRDWLGYAKDEDIPANALFPEGINVALKTISASHKYDNELLFENRKTGLERTVRMKGEALYNGRDTLLSLRGTALDVTLDRGLRQELEREVQMRTEELQAINEELYATNEELHEANQSLVQSNEELSQYAYVASHDLQEPLRKIRLFSESVASSPDISPQNLEVVNKIMRSSERMTSLIQALLEFSRLQRSSSDQVKTTDLNVIIGAVIEDFELLIAERNASITAETLPTIDAVGLQMNQMFYNLIGNALKFTETCEKPLITITCKPIAAEEVIRHIHRPLYDIPYYQITVSDNGIGFDQEFAEQIFEVFKRLHGKNLYPGSGIGLALCRRIARNHGGALHAVGETDVGASFHILLPVRQLLKRSDATV